jgi:hypothetical protein
MIRPRENLIGVDGSFRPMRIQRIANTGANAQTNSEFIDWNQLLG